MAKKGKTKDNPLAGDPIVYVVGGISLLIATNILFYWRRGKGKSRVEGI